MAKNKTLVWFGIAAVLVWYFMRNKKTNNMSGKPGFDSQEQTAIQDAGNMARSIVSDVVEKTTFTPANVSDRELYKKDKKGCQI